MKIYKVDKNGAIRWVKDEEIEDNYYAKDIRIGHNAIYLATDCQYNVLVREGERYKYKEGPWYAIPHPILILESGVAFIDLVQRDRIDIYDSVLNFVCTKNQSNYRDVSSSSCIGDKIFLSRSSGISTWVPDTSVSAIRSNTDIHSTPHIKIWPNPSVGRISITWDQNLTHPDKLRIINQLGKTVYEAKIPTGAESMTWDGSVAPTGVYLIQISHSKGIDVGKVLLR
jgi:hypothetical protein